MQLRELGPGSLPEAERWKALGCSQAEGCAGFGGLPVAVWKMVRALSGPARPRRAAASILREETRGPRDARGIGVKLRGAGEEAGPGVRRPSPRRPPPSLAALARHRLGPSPLPPPARSPPAARSPAPPHSPARARRSSARATAG